MKCSSCSPSVIATRIVQLSPPIRSTGIPPAAHLYLVIVTGSFSSPADSSNWNCPSCSPGDCNPGCSAPPLIRPAGITPAAHLYVVIVTQIVQLPRRCSFNWSPYRRTCRAFLCPTLGAICRDGNCDSSAGKIKKPKSFYCLQIGTYINSLAVHALRLVP